MQLLVVAVGFSLLSLYDYFSAKKWEAEIILGIPYFLKDVRTLSGAVEHQKLSDELRQARSVKPSRTRI